MITTWSHGVPESNMAEEILTDLQDIITRHPWWLARSRLALRLLDAHGVPHGGRVLDAGCGWGVTLAALANTGYRVDGLDVSRRALERLDGPGRSLIEADLTSPPPPAERGVYDAALALDVIEHVDSDRAVIHSLAEVVRPGGIVIVSVPALPDLYSDFDAVQGHRRRYMPDVLRAVFDGTALHLCQLFWWGEWMVPVLRWQRRGQHPRAGEQPVDTYRRHLRLPPWPVPALMAAAFRLEEGRALKGRTRTGTSLVAVAQRTAAP